MAEIATTNRKPPIGIVREWTIALGILTAGTMTRVEAEMKLAAYVPLLQSHFVVGAFTQQSLHHVAAQCKWFPSYAEVVGHLGDWWREHRPLPPSPPALPAPPPLPFHKPTDEELAHIRACVEEVTAGLRYRDDTGPNEPRAARPAYLSPGLLDQINPLPNGRKRVAEGVS
jgi:hypothetical protein